MTTDPDLPLPAQRAALSAGVAGELEAIFASAGPANVSAGAASKVRSVTSRRSRLPIAGAGALAAACLVGLTAGAAMVGARGGPAPPPTPAPAPVATAVSAAPQRMLPVQVAAVQPTVTLPQPNGPIPVLDNAPVADTPAARDPGRATAAAHRRPVGPADLMAADRRLRVAYSHAVRAGVPRHVLASYRDRWEDLREDASWRPARVAAGYGQMSADLERMARRPRHAQPASRRFSLFGLFS